MSLTERRFDVVDELFYIVRVVCLELDLWIIILACYIGKSGRVGNQYEVVNIKEDNIHVFRPYANYSELNVVYGDRLSDGGLESKELLLHARPNNSNSRLRFDIFVAEHDTAIDCRIHIICL